MARLLKPGGVAIVSVPALPELYSEFDAIQGHRRRYLPEVFRAAFADTGLGLRGTFWWARGWSPILRRSRLRAATNSRSSRNYADYLKLPPWPLPVLMATMFAFEHRRAIRGRLRTGTSLLATAVNGGQFKDGMLVVG